MWRLARVKAILTRCDHGGFRTASMVGTPEDGSAVASGKIANPTLSTLTSQAVGLTLLALAAWVVAYSNLIPFAETLFKGLPLKRQTMAGEAVYFFLYEVPKVLLLLTLVVFIMGVVRSFFSPERTRALLARHGGAWNTIPAATLGIVTPFCSCSAVPLFNWVFNRGCSTGCHLCVSDLSPHGQ